MTGAYGFAGETLEASFTKTYSGTVTHGRSTMVFDFSLLANVYLNPTSHGYDFVYQLTNTGANNTNSDSFDRITMSSFAGYSVDADYDASTGMVENDPEGVPPSNISSLSPGDVAPDEVDLSSDGSVVGYSFPLGGEVAPQEVTDYLIVRTDSASYTMGSATVIDALQGSVPTQVPFGAVVQVPEPGSIALIVVSLGLLARRRSAR
jgi:hypothetical protein